MNLKPSHKYTQAYSHEATCRSSRDEDDPVFMGSKGQFASYATAAAVGAAQQRAPALALLVCQASVTCVVAINEGTRA